MEISQNYNEVFIGLVYPTGSYDCLASAALNNTLTKAGYEIITIKVSDIICKFTANAIPKDEFNRIETLMNIGNEYRMKYAPNILAHFVASLIYTKRPKAKDMNRVAYIIDSLKHPDEVKSLHKIYGDSFYVFSVSASYEKRINNFIDKGLKREEAKHIIGRDLGESMEYGQKVTDSFQMGDFFFDTTNIEQFHHHIIRVVDLMHSHPYHTPTKEEYAMYSAYVASTKSADLSRQVGAVIANECGDILATGTNDCQKAFGGQYWPEENSNHKIVDCKNGRDYTLEYDTNKKEQSIIKTDIIDMFKNKLESSEKERLSELLKDCLENSQINSLTEYGRIVHAEMDALMCCARNGISTQGMILYCTTFPCHNCAKHIIAAGIKKVYYIEPYPKSKTFDFYNKEISDNKDADDKVIFKPYMGIGPNRYLELFLMKYKGDKKERKDKTGKTIDFKITDKKIRSSENFFIYRLNEESSIAFVKEIKEDDNLGRIIYGQESNAT